MYHGADRCREPEWLACQDVVVTSYAVVASELAAHKSEGSDGGERGVRITMHETRYKDELRMWSVRLKMRFCSSRIDTPAARATTTWSGAVCLKTATPPH